MSFRVYGFEMGQLALVKMPQPAAGEVCPPKWVVQLARLRPDDDGALVIHLSRCKRCSKIFAGALDDLVSLQFRSLAS